MVVTFGARSLTSRAQTVSVDEAVTEMVMKCGVNQFKFDGTGNADRVVKSSE